MIKAFDAVIKTFQLKAAWLLLCVLILSLSVFVWRKHQPSHMPLKLITVHAIVKNNAGKPIQGAVAYYANAQGQEVGDRYLMIALSGPQGVVDNRVPFAPFPTRYTAVVNAGGYLASAPQTVSAWHDSTIYVILKKNLTHPPRSWIGGG